jgi:hypothetical protein
VFSSASIVCSFDGLITTSSTWISTEAILKRRAGGSDVIWTRSEVPWEAAVLDRVSFVRRLGAEMKIIRLEVQILGHEVPVIVSAVKILRALVPLIGRSVETFRRFALMLEPSVRSIERFVSDIASLVLDENASVKMLRGFVRLAGRVVRHVVSFVLDIGLSVELGGAFDRVPPVALTAYACAEDRRKALVAGFQNRAAKPTEPQELVIAIANLAGRYA